MHVTIAHDTRDTKHEIFMHVKSPRVYIQLFTESVNQITASQSMDPFITSKLQDAMCVLRPHRSCMIRNIVLAMQGMRMYGTTCLASSSDHYGNPIRYMLVSPPLRAPALQPSRLLRCCHALSRLLLLCSCSSFLLWVQLQLGQHHHHKNAEHCIPSQHE